MSERRTISHYELESLLGEGGMGAVYLARDVILDRPVAIKLLNNATVGDPEFLERFKREARLAAQLNHPNIATIYEFGEEDGESFIAMELVEGKTLSQLLNQGALEFSEVRRLGRQAALALSAAHARGIVHRDIKCPNLMLTSDGTLKVMDFGVSRRMTDTQVTMAGALVGTAHIMAPEIIQGQGAGPEADLFSLGCVLYELTAGVPAFEGDQAMSILFRIVNSEPTPLTELRPDVPPDILGVVEGLMIKDLTERFGPAQAVADALESGYGAPAPTPGFSPGDTDATIAPGSGVSFTPPPGTGAGLEAPTMVPTAPPGTSPPFAKTEVAPGPAIGAPGRSWIRLAVLGAIVLAVGIGAITMLGGDGGSSDDAAATRAEPAALSDERLQAMALNDSAMGLPRGRVEEARRLLMEAVSIDGGYVMPWQNLGEVYKVNGDLALAEQARQEGLRRHPDDPILLLGMADILELRGDTTGAVANYRNALEKGAEGTFRATAMNNLGHLYVTTGESMQALGLLSEATEEFPENPALRKNLGLAQVAMNTPDLAEASFREALRLAPGYVAASTGLAESLEAQAKWPEAAAQWQELSTLPESAVRAQGLAPQDVRNRALAGMTRAAKQGSSPN